MPLRHRHEYAADLPRGLPGSSCPPPREFPAPPIGQVRTAPGPDPPGSSRCRIKGLSHAGSSRTPLHPARRTRTIWQYWPVPALSGLLPPSPAPPGSGCPQLHRPAATGSAVKVSHLHSNHSASRRTHDLRHTVVSLLLELGTPPHIVQAIARHSEWTSAKISTPTPTSTPCARRWTRSIGRPSWSTFAGSPASEPHLSAVVGPWSARAGSSGARGAGRRRSEPLAGSAGRCGLVRRGVGEGSGGGPPLRQPEPRRRSAFKGSAA